MAVGTQEMRPLAIPTLREGVLQRVKGAIFDGTLVPGERVNEGRIADQLGISRAPLREALAALAEEGLVIRVPRKGSFVAKISMTDGINMYEVRNALEAFAVERADQPSLAFIANLNTLVDEMANAADKREIAVLVDVDCRFHEQLVLLSGNPWLRRAWQQMNSTTSLFYLHMLNSGAVTFEEVSLHHRTIVQGLERGDMALAAQVVRQQYDDWVVRYKGY